MELHRHCLTTISLLSLLALLARPIGCAGGQPTSNARQTPTPADQAGSPALTTERYSWRNVTIMGGGFVPGIIFNAKERNLMYARTDIGGAYRWDETAREWIPLTDWISPDDSESARHREPGDRPGGPEPRLPRGWHVHPIVGGQWRDPALDRQGPDLAAHRHELQDGRQ